MDTIVLNYESAIKWIKEQITQLVADYEIGETETKDVIADLLDDIDIIVKGKWDWVGIEECPMAISNINVFEMVPASTKDLREKERNYLREKEEVCGLDKEERYTLLAKNKEEE